MGRQLRTARVLADLLTQAVRDGLPPVAWTVRHAGAILVGHCYGRTGADRRYEFQTWCATVGATPGPRVTTAGGTIHLRAVAPDYDGLVDIILLADVYGDDETGDQQ